MITTLLKEYLLIKLLIMSQCNLKKEINSISKKGII